MLLRCLCKPQQTRYGYFIEPFIKVVVSEYWTFSRIFHSLFDFLIALLLLNFLSGSVYEAKLATRKFVSAY